MQHILVPDLNPDQSYALTCDGTRWYVTTLVLDHRTADGTYAIRFSSVVGTGTRVDVGASLDLVPGLTTTIKVLDPDSGTAGTGPGTAEPNS